MKRLITTRTKGFDINKLDGNPILIKSFNACVIDKVKLDELNKICNKNGHVSVLKAQHLDDVKGTGFLAGYMSTFNNKDLMNDVIRQGAFKKTLKERTPRVLFNHDQGVPIGKIIDAFEDDIGLFAIIQLNLDVQAAKDVFSHFEFGALDSFSIGFELLRFELIEGDDDDNFLFAFDIFEVRLFEVSAVAIPANDEAVVLEIKKVIDENFKSDIESINKDIEKSDSLSDLINTLTALVNETKATEENIADIFISQLKVKNEISDIFIEQLSDTPDPKGIQEDHLSTLQAAQGHSESNTDTPTENGHLLDDKDKAELSEALDELQILFDHLEENKNVKT